MSKNNYNSINLNNNFSLHSITEKISENKFFRKILDEKIVFLLNPYFLNSSSYFRSYKYLAGKYDIK